MTAGNMNQITDAIDRAEDICDPLEHLIEEAAVDSGVVFRPEVLKALAVLKKDDRPKFESLRAQLKSAKCRVTVLDQEIAKESGDAGGRGPTQADILINLALSAELFHAPDGTGFADLEVDGHRETWPIRSKGFRRWLARRYFEETQGAASSEAFQSALNVIEAQAAFSGPERIVHVRVGGLDEKYYLDLCNKTWQAVEIDQRGWRVIDNPPVRFRRSAGMKALPIPLLGGSIDELERFLNVKSRHDFVLVVAWLLAALRPLGPYPIIALSGEHGAAKSTFTRTLKALIDPNTSPLRALPRDDRDMFIAANNGHVLAFDNVSGLPNWISDTLCRLSTGGGFATRQLFTDQDEVLFDATRPVILNGIEEVITKADLADRAIFLTLEQIEEGDRRAEKDLLEDFEIAQPRILGALLDAVALGLVRLPHTRLEKLPRMADFALWATACEGKFWPKGTFWAAYCGNRDDAVEGVLESDMVAVGLRTFIEKRGQWKGTATELLGALGAQVGEARTRSKEWPQSARALSGRLRRAATFLRKVGVEIDFTKNGSRTIHLSSVVEKCGPQPSAPSAPSSNPTKFNGGNGFLAHHMRAVGSNLDGTGDDGGAVRASTVHTNSSKSNDMAAADGMDANLAPQSAEEKNVPPSSSVKGKPGEVGPIRGSEGELAEVEL